MISTRVVRNRDREFRLFSRTILTFDGPGVGIGTPGPNPDRELGLENVQKMTIFLEK
jgi:hypothetical protein